MLTLHAVKAVAPPPHYPPPLHVSTHDGYNYKLYRQRIMRQTTHHNVLIYMYTHNVL